MMHTIFRLAAATLFAGLALTVPHTAGAARPTQAAMVPANHFYVTAGWGTDDYAANIYTPFALQIYAGDTITWRIGGTLEPHTITFGPEPLLKSLANNLTQIKPQAGGPPQVSFNPQAGLPSRSPTYNGSGFANSGLLSSGRSWTLTFTKPGRYQYHCLLHFPGMMGLVVVRPRPTGAAGVTVLTGYGSIRSAVDAFFPEKLAIHVGTTVNWTPGFHTVTFAPVAMIRNLRQHFVIPVPQKGGPPQLSLNPQTVFPSGGPTYDGTGIWNSGLLTRGPAHLTFTKPGVYHYGCLIHPGMDGTITVIP